MAILVKNLKKKVLENAKESDQIIIITGYFSPDMIDETTISRTISAIPRNTKIIS